MRYTSKQKSAIKARITRFSKRKGVSDTTIQKLRRSVDMGHVEARFVALSDVDKNALYETGFDVRKGKNAPPDNVRWVVRWGDFLNIQKS